MRPDLLDFSRPVLVSTLVVDINLLGFRIPAGFPSPAEEHLVQRCDLLELLSTHPQTPSCYSSSRDKKEDTAILTDGKPQKRALLTSLASAAA